MNRLVGVLGTGCCLLAACSPLAAPAQPQHATHTQVALPKITRPWNDEFAAKLELEKIGVAGQEVLIPEGIRLPDFVTVTASTEVALFLATDRPEDLENYLSQSAEKAGYTRYVQRPGVIVWVGKGMSIRLETSKVGQVIAWGPEAMKDDLAEPEG